MSLAHSFPEPLRLLDPVLREWIGEDYLRHCIPQIHHLSYRPADPMPAVIARATS